ncbi:hypothetical protein [Prochlorothrix hollandica]|uniref:hypothetical protein n=1 Tax=Prochlorothrix hollandica TaxID=1223 RepID=UPI00034D3358|nr:hypothetical protein [Prochlorothrix hollandica]
MQSLSSLPDRLKKLSVADIWSLTSQERYQLSLWLKGENWTDLHSFAHILDQKAH